MKKYADITIKYLKKHRSRTFLTIFGIILAIAFFTAISTVYFTYVDTNIENIRSKGNYEVVFRNIESKKIHSIEHNLEVLSSGTSRLIGYSNISINETELGQIKFKALNESGLKNIFPVIIMDGRKPIDSTEIMVEKILVDISKGFAIGDTLELEVETFNNGKNNLYFKIVGIYESQDSKIESEFNAITIDAGLDVNSNYDVYVNLKGSKNKVAVGNKIALSNSLEIYGENSQVEFNEPLLRFYGQSQDPIISKALRNMIILVTSLIITCTTAGIYNIFAISVVERTRHFGILRAIGATSKQIRKIVFKEALIMGGIGIPLGIITGHIVLYILGYVISTLGFKGIAAMKMGLYYQVVLISTVLGFITILLSLWGPSIIATKVSPMDAIKNTRNIKKERIKVRKSKIVRRIFGVEGELGYKNIRRNPKEFWITIFSLVISIVLFISMTNLVSVAKQADNVDLNNRYYQAALYSRGEGGMSQEVLTNINKLRGVRDIYTPVSRSIITAIERDKINSLYPNTNNPQNDRIQIADERFTFVYDVGIGAFDESSLNKAKLHLVDGIVDIEALNTGGVLLVMGSKELKDGTAQNFMDLNIGDTLKLPKLRFTKEESKSVQESINKSLVSNQFDSLKIVGILENNPFSFDTEKAFTLIFTQELYRDIVGELECDKVYIEFDTGEDRNTLYNHMQSLASENNLFYIDYIREREGFYQGMIVYYTVISIVAILGIVSIINTLYMSHLVKRREYAIYKAIGMTKNQFSKLVILQGLLYGLIASVIGIFIGSVVSMLLVRNIQATTDIQLTLPIATITIGLVGVIFLNLIGSILPLKKLHLINISEGLRFEE